MGYISLYLTNDIFLGDNKFKLRTFNFIEKVSHASVLKKSGFLKSIVCALLLRNIFKKRVCVIIRHAIFLLFNFSLEINSTLSENIKLEYIFNICQVSFSYI